MKIGIFTQALTTNYGGILQNYALQQVVKGMGHEVYTFDICKPSWKAWSISAIKCAIKKCLGRTAKFPTLPSNIKRREKPLRRFVKSHIQVTAPRVKLPTAELVDRYSLDGIIVGSDQVWRPLYNYGFIDQLYLAFVKDRDIKRIAYAASFGTDEWEYTKEEEIACAALAKKFNGISVRENSGVALCRDHLGVDAVHVLDPTLLLDSTHYAGLCKHIAKREPFVFAYILDQSEEKVESIKSFATSKGLPYFIMSAGPEVSEGDSIELWLSYFRDANYVITDSFHGTAFSIIFNRDFYVFGNKERGNSRFDSLLGCLELRDRIVNRQVTELPAVEWDKVNAKRGSLRESSLKWLSSNFKRAR